MSHKVWQVFDFLVFKILKLIVIKMLQKQIDVKLFKSCFKFYCNFWFLINKKIKNKYRMINVVMNMNEIIIWNINLLFNVKKFSEKFINMHVISLINFFSEYNQIILIEKLRDLTAFMISFKLFRMI